MIFFKHRKYLASLSALLLAFAAAPDGNAAGSEKQKAGKPAAKTKAKLHKVSANEEDLGEFTNFAQWQQVAAFIDEMILKHGFDRAELESLFRKVQYVERAIQLMKPAPPGRPKNWQAYRGRFVEPIRINAGVAFWDTHAEALARAEKQYGVPAEIIVGIVGVETIYGRYTGNFRVLDAVTTLGFDYPDTPNRTARMAYFRGELENTLLFAREAGIDPLSLQGSYAGAIGWPQFMPGSIRRYAVDFDGDGKIDLRDSPVDAIGSVAHFLVEHGWQPGEPVVFPASVSRTDGGSHWDAFIGTGLEARYRLDELKAAGITTGADTPPDMMYGLVDLQNGDMPTEYWLGAPNFFAITKYNRSYFYAMSVVDLGRAVRAARGR